MNDFIHFKPLPPLHLAEPFSFSSSRAYRRKWMKKALHESLLPARHIIRIGWEAEKKERRGGRPFRACVATYIHRLGKGMRTLKAEKEKKEEKKEKKKLEKARVAALHGWKCTRLDALGWVIGTCERRRRRDAYTHTYINIHLPCVHKYTSRWIFWNRLSL